MVVPAFLPHNNNEKYCCQLVLLHNLFLYFVATFFFDWFVLVFNL